MVGERQLLDVFGNLNSNLLRVVPMIRIHRSRLIGEHNEESIDLLRATGLARNIVTGLSRESSARMDIDTLNANCRHYGCSAGKLREYTAGDGSVEVLK
jgi:putative transcriptional regulator